MISEATETFEIFLEDSETITLREIQVNLATSCRKFTSIGQHAINQRIGGRRTGRSLVKNCKHESAIAVFFCKVYQRASHRRNVGSMIEVPTSWPWWLAAEWYAISRRDWQYAKSCKNGDWHLQQKANAVIESLFPCMTHFTSPKCILCIFLVLLSVWRLWVWRPKRLLPRKPHFGLMRFKIVRAQPIFCKHQSGIIG